MSATFTLFFEPLDVLQFRDARPFDAGLHVHARSVFPLPSVFLGAIRTALFRHAGVDFSGGPFHGPGAEWRTLLGDARNHATFQMRGPLLAWRTRATGEVEARFPAPADLYWPDTERRVQSTDRSAYELGVLERTALQGWGFTRWRWNGRTLDALDAPVPWTSAELAKGGGGALWLNPAGARTYLAHAGGAPLRFERGQGLPATCIFEREARTGIARHHDTLTTIEGLFYVTEPLRLHADATGAYGFAVDLRLPAELGTLKPESAARALHDLDGAVVPLGGKTHRALVRVRTGALLPADLAGEVPLAAGRKRKLWLVTPLPWNERAPQATFAVAERPVPVGGFDLAAHAPRALERALPAGTVLLADGDVRAHLSPAQRLAGYGTALVKELEENEP